MSTAPRQGTDGLTPGDRRELRALVKRRFASLRKDVERRVQEMRAEAEARLVAKYRNDEALVNEMNEEIERARSDYSLALGAILHRYQELLPGWAISGSSRNGASATPTARAQERNALMQAIPLQVQEAEALLDRQEMDLLEKLTLGGLETEQAVAFINAIPTVAQLIPASRLRELEDSYNRQIGGTIGG